MSNDSNVIEVGGKKVGRVIGTVIVVLVLVIIAANAFTTVDAGHSGVVKTFGKVSETVLTEGLHFKIPFIQEIVKIDNRVKVAEVACTSASKDLQNVSSTIALNYNVRSSASAEIYRNVGPDYEAIIINPAIQECVKAVTAKFTAEELITNRQSVGDEMMALLGEKISPFGLELKIFNIISFDFSAEFNAAIEAKQTAQQNALKAQQDLERIKVEAQQKVEQAKAEAEAYRLKSQEITPQMLQMEYINKWNGQLPMVVSDGTSLFDFTSMLEQQQNTSGTPTVQQSAPVSKPVVVQSSAADEEDE